MSQREDWKDHIELPSMRREGLSENRVTTCFKTRPSSLLEIFSKAVGDNPAGEALVYEDNRISYELLGSYIESTASELNSLGIRDGDRVALFLNNSPEYVVFIFAVLRLGAIVVPLNIKESDRGLEYILTDSDVKCLVYHSSIAREIFDNKKISTLNATICLSSRIEDCEFIRKAPCSIPNPEESETNTAIILYTSGTTGKPKGAKISHVNAIHSILHYQYGMELSKKDRSIITVPMSHVTGLVALIFSVIGSSATLVIMDKFSSSEFLHLVEKERITHTLIVPAMFNLCLLDKKLETADLSSWRVSGYGGAIMPEATLKEITRYLPNLALMNCYGATETTSPAAMMPPKFTAEKLDYVGLPVPCAEIFIADEYGKEVDPGSLGEIWVAGPMVVSGYWNNQEATDAEFHGGFWKSGDIGSIDSNGFIKVVDRKKDVINRGGYKVYASEVENVLLEFPGIIEAAVVSSVCSVLGERVNAFVVSNDELNIQKITDHCSLRLAEYKVPERFNVVSELPRNANGKVLKRDLRQLLSDEIKKGEADV